MLSGIDECSLTIGGYMREQSVKVEHEQAVHFESDALRLEGALRLVQNPRLSAVVLHPHPLYGGDMDNHVVMTLCGAMNALGATTLRFNFRGTGASEGAHDNGRGEAGDALAAVRFVRDASPGTALVLVGYSFGAIVAASSSAAANVAALVLVSPPAGVASLSALPDGVPALAVTGSEDGVAPADAVRQLESPNCAVKVVDGADHAWWGRTDELAKLVSDFVTATFGLEA
jgi:alpha/beta superfamily hydrolase